MKKLLNNWPLKLLSVILAVILWFIIMALADPTDTMTVYNVPVKIVNIETLQEAGMSYTVKGGDAPAVNLRVTASGSILRELTAASFSLTADVNDINSITHRIPIEAVCLNPSVSNSQIVLMTESVEIEYEKILSKDFTISISRGDDLPEGYFIGSERVTPRTVRVTAPESVIARIAKVVTTVDVSELTESRSISADLEFYTDGGSLIDLSLYKDTKASIDGCTVDLEVLTKKTLPVVISKEALDEAKAQLPDGYRYTGSQQSVTSVDVRGVKSRLADVTVITIPAGTFDLSGATESKSFTLNLQQYLPEGLQIMDTSEKTVTVTLDVEALAVKAFDITGVLVTGREDGFRYTYSNTVQVYIRALEDDFAFFDTDLVTVSVDLGEYATAPGTWHLPVTVSCSDNVFTPLPRRTYLNVTVEEIIPPTTPVPENTEPADDPDAASALPPEATMPSAD